MKAHLVATGKHFDMYEVKGKTEPYTVSYDKDKKTYRCDCPHGSGNFKGVCWHVKEVRKIRHETIPKMTIIMNGMTEEAIRKFKKEFERMRK